MQLPLVVDADGHCQEPEDGLAQWMPAELAGRAPRRITDNLGQPRILLEGRVWGKSEDSGRASADRSRRTRDVRAAHRDDDVLPALRYVHHERALGLVA